MLNFAWKQRPCSLLFSQTGLSNTKVSQVYEMCFKDVFRVKTGKY